MNKKFQIIATSLAIGLMSTPAYSQNGVNSPYSRYGFGMQGDRSLGFNKGMSGVSQGFRRSRDQRNEPCILLRSRFTDSLDRLWHDLSERQLQDGWHSEECP